MRLCLILASALLLSGCASLRQFSADQLWPFGNPNGPASHSETATRARGASPTVAPILPQKGNVWPGPVPPMPTIADEEKQMTQPLGQAYTPSLPSPYPPGVTPPANADLSMDPNSYTVAPGAGAVKVKASTGSTGGTGN